MEPQEQRKVRFNPDVEQTLLLDGKWSFLRYLLTLNEEINLQIVFDTLEDRGALLPSDKEDVLQQKTYKDRIDTCIQRVMRSCPAGYSIFCEVLKDCGYNHVVDSLKSETEDEDSISKYTLNSEEFNEKSTKEISMQWERGSPLTPSQSDVEDRLAIVGVKMSLTSLSKDTKASQKEFNTIIQRQSELEKQLAEVMKTLDTAKEALIRERQEKQYLVQQLSVKDGEIAEMQRKYRDLQSAMGKLKETNNKFHDRVTKLQIENEQLRKSTKDKSNLQIDLKEKHEQIKDLKRTIEDQEKQISSQELMINKKLSMIEKLAIDHQRLADGQTKLEDLITKQTEQIMKLNSERDDAHQQLVQQQKQLSSQQASLAMLQENLERLEISMLTQQEQQNVLALYPPDHNYRGKKQTSTTKPMMVRPFNTSGKVENSKNTYWKNPNDLSGRGKIK